MAVKARLETQITGDEAPFVAAVNRAEKHAQSFQGRLQSLFKRDPTHKTGAALGSFVADAASGNIQSAVIGLTSRMRGLGLGLTVATVAGIAFYDAIKAARKESEGLSDALDKVNKPTGPASLNTLDSLTQKLAGIREERQKLVKHEAGFGPMDVLGDAFSNLTHLPTTNWREAQATRAKQTEESFAAEKRAVADITTKYRALADIEQERRHGSEETAAAKKSESDFQEKYGQLIQAGPNQNPAAAAQLKRIHDEELAGIHQAFEIKGRELAVEQDLAAMAAKGASADDQKARALKDHLGLIEDQLAFSQQLTSEERLRLNLAKTKGETALRDQQLGQFLKSPQLLQKEAQMDEAHQRDIARFERAGGSRTPSFDMNGNLIPGKGYSMHPDAYKLSPQRGLGHGAAGAPKTTVQEELTISGMRSLMQEFWGGS